MLCDGCWNTLNRYIPELYTIQCERRILLNTEEKEMIICSRCLSCVCTYCLCLHVVVVFAHLSFCISARVCIFEQSWIRRIQQSVWKLKSEVQSCFAISAVSSVKR